MTSQLLLILPFLAALDLPSTASPADSAERGGALAPFGDVHWVEFSPEASQETVDRLWEQNPRDGAIVVVGPDGTVTVSFPEGYVPDLRGIEGEPGVTVGVN